MSFDKPIRHMREYLEILMTLLHTGAANFEGETPSSQPARCRRYCTELLNI